MKYMCLGQIMSILVNNQTVHQRWVLAALLPAQLPAKVPGKAAEDGWAHVLLPLHLWAISWWSSWHLFCPCPGYLKSEPDRCKIYVCVCLPFCKPINVFRKNENNRKCSSWNYIARKKYLKNKNEIKTLILKTNRNYYQQIYLNHNPKVSSLGCKDIRAAFTGGSARLRTC